MFKGQFNDTKYARKAFFAAAVIGRVAFGCDEFVEDSAVSVEAVAVDVVADGGVDVAADVVEVDAVVVDVDGS